VPRLDDPTIPDDALLWRRVPPDQVKPLADGGFRVSSAAFRDKTGELSVHVASLTDGERALGGYPLYSLAQLSASVPRSLGFSVSRDPLPNDNSHALICPKASKGHASKLAQSCTWAFLREP